MKYTELVHFIIASLLQEAVTTTEQWSIQNDEIFVFVNAAEKSNVLTRHRSAKHARHLVHHRVPFMPGRLLLYVGMRSRRHGSEYQRPTPTPRGAADVFAQYRYSVEKLSFSL